MNRSRGRAWWLASALLALSQSACTSWQLAVVGSGHGALAVVEEERPKQVRVTTGDGRVVTIERPLARGDSIFADPQRTPVALLSNEVRRLEVRRFSPGRTLAIVLAVPVLYGSLLFIALGSGSGAN